MSQKFSGVQIKGARENNLKNVNVNIPRNKITVFTGLSGSGKSTLAFDTIFAEGRRRYVESLSTYARQFLDQFKKPDVDSIFGLSPTIAIEQRTTVNSPRSTVGTITELYDYIRLLFSKVGTAHCPEHGIPMTALNAEQIVQNLLSLPKGTKVHILSPLVRNKKGEFQKDFQKWLKSGYLRAKINGAYYELEKTPKLNKNKTQNIELVVDRVIVKDELKERIEKSVHDALQLSDGLVTFEVLDSKKTTTYSSLASCPVCHSSPPDIEPRLFSFNDPRGYCLTCHGLGVLDKEDYDLEEQELDDYDSEEIDQLHACYTCKGSRLNQHALNVFINGVNIYHVSSLSLVDLQQWINHLELTENQSKILEKLIYNLNYKVKFLLRLGVGHLSLLRGARTLSGGEAQRIRLANQLGSPLVGVLYVLDEPSIGLHPKDQKELLKALAELRDQGNTILVVEHDEDTILSSDYVVDIGPRAGKLGGSIVVQGSPEKIKNFQNSLTGQYLSKKRRAYALRERKDFENFLSLTHATGNNLKDVSIHIPKNTLTSITGVSGSGKSTLIFETLYKYLANLIYERSYHPQPFAEIAGYESFEGVIEINQRPIGKTPRSNPATYVGLFTLVRDLFSKLPESRLRGYKPARFSFNVKGGRCESCQGAGQTKVEMHFMADVYVQCDVCQGKRYNQETLSVTYRGKNINDILNMSIAEALGFFENHEPIRRKLDLLNQVGLDYIHLGQSSTTLSGGEAQRIKLSKELSKKRSGEILYILDEPTTGLHFEDTKHLIELLHRLVDQGHTVLTIEHNLDVIASSDYIIDLGPGSGVHGGEVIFEGTVSDLLKNKKSYTGQFLKKHLAD